jgi:hypothetical protein
MSRNVSRVGDIGVGYCLCHFRTVAVVFIKGSQDTQTNSRDTMMVGGIGIASCKHLTVAVTGLDTVLVNQSPIHRVGDAGVINCFGGYVSITGSENVLTGT